MNVQFLVVWAFSLNLVQSFLHSTTNHGTESLPKPNFISGSNVFPIRLLQENFTEISLGSFTELDHSVSGTIVALSESVLEIRNFTYDGAAPDAYLWADTSSTPSDRGFILYDADPGSCGQTKLASANGTTQRIEFPDGKSINDILGGSIAVWCRTYAANFGNIVIPSSLNGIPNTASVPVVTCLSSDSDQEISIGTLSTIEHQVTGEVVVISDRILEIRGFVFDGEAPQSFFWADTNSVPSDGGFPLQDALPTTSCGSKPLISADGSQVYRVEFPDGKSINDILGGSISVWCREFSADLGHIIIPTNLITSKTNVTNLQCASSSGSSGSSNIAKTPDGYNCEQLNDDFQVRWMVVGEELAIELIGRIDETSYMAFGPSGSDASTTMDGANPVVADFFQGSFRARDYYMISRAQCSSGEGVCPDTESNYTDDITNVSGERNQDAGITLIRYKTPLQPTDNNSSVRELSIDRSILVTNDARTYIVWALGPISTETGFAHFHSIDYLRFNMALEFGRDVIDNCIPLVEDISGETTKVDPFERPILSGVTEFDVVIGPSGGRKGYTGITGKTAWGIAWYINDFIIPVIELRRGTTYTFHVNGGDNSSIPSQFFPFYITSGKSGGYSQLTPEERMQETVYAGITITNGTSQGVYEFDMEGLGPLCSYQYGPNSEASLELNYEQFFQTLNTSCATDPNIADKAGKIEFTPDKDTPDTIYYQCATYRNLGWEISVVDANAPVAAPTSKSSSNSDHGVLNSYLTITAVIIIVGIIFA